MLLPKCIYPKIFLQNVPESCLLCTLLYPVSLLDDHHRNPNINDRNHLVGQLLVKLVSSKLCKFIYVKRLFPKKLSKMSLTLSPLFSTWPNKIFQQNIYSASKKRKCLFIICGGHIYDGAGETFDSLLFYLLRVTLGRPGDSPVRYPNWFNSKFEFCAKLIQFNIQFKIILGKFNSKDYSTLDKSILFNSMYYSIYNKLLWFNSIYYSINNYCLWFNSKDYSN